MGHANPANTVGAALIAPAHGIGALNKTESVLLLRWVLIIATSYLVVFSRPLAQTPVSVPLFIVAYFASNILLTELLPRMHAPARLDVGIVLLDTFAVCIGVALTGGTSSQFFVVYFVVLFLSALTERLELVVVAAALISAAHVYTESRYVGWVPLISRGYILRIPFLFVVAMFFGNLVQEARSRQRAAEDARARVQRMEVLATISHDLKNALGVIQSIAALLLEGDVGPLNPDQGDFLRRIHAGTQHVITFALNLIDAARIEAGHLVLERKTANLMDVIADALLLARSASDVKGLTLQCTVEPNLPPLRIDVMHIERVIANLLGNAIKYTPAGGTVTLSVCALNDGIALSVCDDGPGIPSHELSGLFEKYRRHSESGGIEGSGLGLFITKAIVEAHGGTVALRSMVGYGTTVTIYLPIREPDPPHEPTVTTLSGGLWRRWGLHGHNKSPHAAKA
jgi:signal transduction histidine kinase